MAVLATMLPFVHTKQVKKDPTSLPRSRCPQERLSLAQQNEGELARISWWANAMWLCSDLEQSVMLSVLLTQDSHRAKALDAGLYRMSEPLCHRASR